MNIGTVVENRRVNRGISYAELARRTSINEEMISRFCKNKSMLKADQFIRLCIELELDIDDFSQNNK